MIWLMNNVSEVLMQIRGLAIHDGLEIEKRNFILNRCVIGSQ